MDTTAAWGLWRRISDNEASVRAPGVCGERLDKGGAHMRGHEKTHGDGVTEIPATKCSGV